jgi:protein transport protein SEC61 subunit gamma and related proteins
MPEIGEIVDKSWDVQRRIEERAKRLGKGRYGRVLKMARKPTPEEYSRVVMVVGVGLLFIGLLGFVIYWFMKYGFGYFENLFR